MIVAVWAPIMTSLRDHRKSAEAGDRAMWLYICIHLFCHERDTNGTVSVHELNSLNAQRGKVALTKRLVTAGLLREIDDGWAIVKYDEKRPIAALQAEKRKNWREQKRRQRAEMSADMSVDKKLDSPPVRAEQSNRYIDTSISEPSTSSGSPF